jgi:hypothetical protein
LAYISGFGGSNEKYIDFEQAWIWEKVMFFQNSRHTASVEAIIYIGKELVTKHNQHHPNEQLKFVDCGTNDRIRSRSDK